MLKLVGTDGKQLYSWDLEPGKYTIGRRSECDFPVSDNTVSRKHAEMEVVDGECFLTDLGSHNGTMLNGSRVTERVQVFDGDRILFGQAEFKVTGSNGESGVSSRPTKTRLSNNDPRNSVYLSINDALQPLPKKATELPELIPALFDMAKMLAQDDPKEIMLEKSLKMISRIIPAERLAVLSVEEGNDEVFTVATLLPDGRDPGEFELSRTIINQIITAKDSILIGDPKDDPRFAEQKSIIMSELKSAIAVPLFDQGRVLGILYIDTTNPLHRYADDHMRVLATCGNIIASRLLNYELLEKREQNRVIEAELDRASKIQENLLVEKPPEVEGLQTYAVQEQSRSVGGDLYDIKILKDGKLLFLVADVSGKGMGAALLMTNILASFRILYDSSEFDVVDALSRASLHLHDYSRSGDFATTFLGTVDCKTGEIQYVNAGHNPPAVIRKDGSVDYLEPTGMMIGAFDFCEWKQDTVKLEEGDFIFVYSDGVTEAQPTKDDKDQYGEERLEKLLVDFRNGSPKEISEKLMSDINDHMGDAPRSDDITVLVIKRVGV